MYENERAFIDFIYNRYVDAVRKCDGNDRQYRQILGNCIQLLTLRRYAPLRRYAKERIKEIRTAERSETLGKLRKVGQEGEIEFRKEIEDYEQKLREFNFSEEFIRDRINQKKEDYHNR